MSKLYEAPNHRFAFSSTCTTSSLALTIPASNSVDLEKRKGEVTRFLGELLLQHPGKIAGSEDDWSVAVRDENGGTVLSLLLSIRETATSSA